MDMTLRSYFFSYSYVFSYPTNKTGPHSLASGVLGNPYLEFFWSRGGITPSLIELEFLDFLESAYATANTMATVAGCSSLEDWFVDLTFLFARLEKGKDLRPKSVGHSRACSRHLHAATHFGCLK